MKYIIILLLLMPLRASELTFTALRSEARTLALVEFKKLYKKRQNIHRNLRQVLKHSRAKNLQKNQLSFFQPMSAMEYEDHHPIEVSNVYVTGDNPCGDDCQPLPEDGEIDNSTSINPDEVFKEESGIRYNVVSPWILR